MRHGILQLTNTNVDFICWQLVCDYDSAQPMFITNFVRYTRNEKVCNVICKIRPLSWRMTSGCEKNLAVMIRETMLTHRWLLECGHTRSMYVIICISLKATVISASTQIVRDWRVAGGTDWWNNHIFALSSHLQDVCKCLWFREVKLTIPSCLCIFRVYVKVLDGSVKLSWPFILSLHFQNVCECLGWFCEVELTIPSCLYIFRRYVNVLDGSVKLSWPFHHVFAFSGSMWISWMVLWSWADHPVFAFSACMWMSSMIPQSQADHSILSLYFQFVCQCLQWFCEIKLTIPSCLCIFRVYVNVFYDSAKSSWSFHPVFAFSGCMWMSSMVLWSQADHSILSLHFQGVCECLLWFCDVKLTTGIPFCLCISACMWMSSMVLWCQADYSILFLHFSMYVNVFYGSVKSNWPFHCIFSLYVNVFYGSMKSSWPFHCVFAFSVCMWMSSIVLQSQSDYYSILSLHFSMYVNVFYGSVKSSWPFHSVFAFQHVNIFYGFVKSSWPFHHVFAFSGCMWMSSMVLWNQADYSILSLHFQDVCECLLWIHEVKLTIPFCFCIFSLYVNVLYGSVKLSWYSILFVNSQKVGYFFSPPQN